MADYSDNSNYNQDMWWEAENGNAPQWGPPPDLTMNRKQTLSLAVEVA